MAKLTKAKFMAYFEGVLVPPSHLEEVWKKIESDLHGDDKTNLFLATYIREYRARYGRNPIIKGKPSGIAKRVVKDHGAEQASAWVAAYLKMSEYDMIRSRHDLVVFERNLQAVAEFAETGRSMTRTEAVRADKAQATANAFGKALERRRGE